MPPAGWGTNYPGNWFSSSTNYAGTGAAFKPNEPYDKKSAAYDVSAYTGISFKINSRERVGLVGRNGHGKTTLFRMITGEETPDEGQIVIPRNYRIGYVEQRLTFTEDTVRAEAARALTPDAHNEIWRVEKILAGLGEPVSGPHKTLAEEARLALEEQGANVQFCPLCGYQNPLSFAKCKNCDAELK